MTATHCVRVDCEENAKWNNLDVNEHGLYSKYYLGWNTIYHRNP